MPVVKASTLKHGNTARHRYAGRSLTARRFDVLRHATVSRVASLDLAISALTQRGAEVDSRAAGLMPSRPAAAPAWPRVWTPSLRRIDET
jgi:hypothetical protein